MVTNQDLMAALSDIMGAWARDEIDASATCTSIDALLKAGQLIDRDSTLKTSDKLLLGDDKEQRTLFSMDDVRARMDALIAQLAAKTVDAEYAKTLMNCLNILSNTYKLGTSFTNNVSNVMISVDGKEMPIDAVLTTELLEASKDMAAQKNELAHCKRQLNYFIKSSVAVDWSLERETQWQALVLGQKYWTPPQVKAKEAKEVKEGRFVNPPPAPKKH